MKTLQRPFALGLDLVTVGLTFAFPTLTRPTHRPALYCSWPVTSYQRFQASHCILPLRPTNMSRRTPTTTPPTSRPSSRAAKGKQAASSTPQLRQVDALPVGQTYIKNRDDPSSSGRASGAVSGRSTPLPIQAMRPGVKILPAKLPKPAVGAGGLTSDLLTPKGATKAKAAAPASSSSSAKTEEQLPKSVEVERLERMIHDVELTGESGEGLGKRALKKGKGGCFCQGKLPSLVLECDGTQERAVSAALPRRPVFRTDFRLSTSARIHPLNTYNPICPTCSLPLCALQLPYLPCPSCHTSLLVAPSLRSRLLVTLNRELTEQLNMERLERERLAQEEADRLWAESGGGKFPSLLSGLVKKEEPKTRRVMSLNPKTGKVRVEPTDSPQSCADDTCPDPNDILSNPPRLHSLRRGRSRLLVQQPNRVRGAL